MNEDGDRADGMGWDEEVKGREKVVTRTPSLCPTLIPPLFDLPSLASRLSPLLSIFPSILSISRFSVVTHLIINQSILPTFLQIGSIDQVLLV